MKSTSLDLRTATNEYKEKLDVYSDFSIVMAEILKSILENEEIAYQTISTRAKTIESFREKIKRKRVQGIFYKNLTDVTDLAGIRIILYFKDDIDRVLEIIDEEFDEIVQKLSSKKTKPVHGYSAHHRIVKLTRRRANLNEYKRFKNMRVEIQVKTNLQHAWAEIEHGIGYKPKVTEKELERGHIRERFINNANLIEKVDKNFVEIRKLHTVLLNKYQNSIDEKDLEIPINYDSVAAFLKKKYKNRIVKKQQVLEVLGQLEKNKRLTNLADLQKAIDIGDISFTFD